MGSMDRESVRSVGRFETANLSTAISGARYAWSSVHFPTAGFAAGTLTWEVWNEADEAFVVAVDANGATLPTVAVTPGMVLPVDQNVNHARVYRVNMSSAQPVDLEFKVVNKT